MHWGLLFFRKKEGPSGDGTRWKLHFCGSFFRKKHLPLTTPETEDWQLDFEWLRVRTLVQETLGYDKLPDLNAMLLVIGMQELGQIRETWTKEEKQDLMHIAVCSLLSQEGYYEFEGLDADGWPHFRQLVPVDTNQLKAQENLLKQLVIRYIDQSM